MWLIVKGSEGEDENMLLAYALKERPLIVGRSDKSELVLNDAKVSGKHLELRLKEDKVEFKDLESRYGTHFKGERANSGYVEDGDELVIGSTHLGFCKNLPNRNKGNRSPLIKKAKKRGGNTLFEGLSEMVSRIREYERPRKVLSCLLEELVTALSAERGYILLKEGAKDRLVCVASHAIEEQDDFISLSSTVYSEALRSGKTVAISDSSTGLPDRQSPLSMSFYPSARSILCSPLVSDGAAFGVVYLDMPAEQEGIDAGALQVIETLSAIASERLSKQKTRYRLVAARERLTALQALGWKDRRLVLGSGESSKQLRESIKRATMSETSVLIIGETGTGKEMVARALHQASTRRSGPFVPVNCAALPRELLESELFGAEKGAYTGAEERRLGRFELANGGVLFLDEVGELPLSAQVKLLRVLQEKVLTRIGGTEEIPLDFRLVCATNRDLEEAIEKGSFRADLYYRINVFRMDLPPLRKQPEEILPLAEFFLTMFNKRFSRELKGFSKEAERALIDYQWPGNIRELRNTIERAVVIQDGDEVTLDHLPIASKQDKSSIDGGFFIGSLPHDFNSARDQFEKSFLERSLAANDNNIAAVVRETGLGRPTVYRWLKKYGLRSKE